MELEVNGGRQNVPDHTTIARLLSDLGITARHVAVEVNRELVPRTNHDSHVLSEGDQLEIVTLVGGG